MIVVCKIKYYNDLDEHGSTSSSSSLWSSGASVLDLVFPQAESVSEIRLRNWYFLNKLISTNNI